MKKYLISACKFGRELLLSLLILVSILHCDNVLSQKTSSKPTRQSSLEAFSKGDYEFAFIQFQELLRTYPKDPLYKYYSGVCLVRLEKKPSDAVAFLTQAVQGAALVKTLPPDALFYLGRAQQMAGKFSDALSSFNMFTDQAGRKESKELGVPEFVKQCNEKSGQIMETNTVPRVTAIVNKADTAKNKSLQKSLPAIQQPVFKEKKEQVPLPDVYEKILSDAIELQFKSDSVTALVQQQKKELDGMTEIDKQAARTTISHNELLAATLQKEADKKYSEAQLFLNPQTRNQQQKEMITLPATAKPVRDSLPRPDSAKVRKTTQQPDSTEVIKTIQQPDNKVNKVIDRQVDTLKKVIPAVQKETVLFSQFDVLEKPVSDPKEKIVIDGEGPVGLVYRIQIAVFRNLVSPSYFKGITPVYGFRIPGSDKTNFYAGIFRKIKDANSALAKVKSKGFKDAYVVAFSGNKSVSAERAVNMEKEWGSKPLYPVVEKQVQLVPLDTVPPTLAFRVEVVRSLKPLKEDVLDGIKKMAANRGLDIQTSEDGKNVYLIGKFITFESAAEYADLLIRNGYREAKVVAFLGKKEIPVETAKQLFENLE